MAGALNPGFLSGFLQGLGVESAAARVAGAKLSVVVGFLGGGMLLVGMSWLARAGRLRHAWAQHAAMLAEIAQPMGGHVQYIGDDALGFSAEVRGLRVQVELEPTGQGAICIYAHCPPQQNLEIWPRGMGPEAVGQGWQPAAEGRSWELWAQVILEGSGPNIDPVLQDALDGAFGPGGTASIRHDAAGIELQMAHVPGLDPRNRVPLAVEAVIALARTNH